MRDPEISVVMPVYNAGPFLAPAIESILTQTFGDFEMIIADDGSDDGSADVIAAYAAQDRRIRPVRLVHDPATVSGAKADNAVQALARGQFIARMDHDDVSMPERFEVQLDLMRIAGLDVCGGQARYCGDWRAAMWFPQDHAAIQSELFFRPAMVHASQMMRREVRRGAPLSETTTAEDYDWQARVILDRRFGNAPQELVHYRIHPTQCSQVRRERVFRDWAQVRLRYFFALFPEAGMADFQALHHVITKAQIATEATLERAGYWLARLAAPPCDQLRRRMADRWTRACESAQLPDAVKRSVREQYAAALAADG